MLKQFWQAWPNLVLGTGGILVALILLEITANLLPAPYDAGDAGYVVCSNELGWRGSPNYTGSLNTDGYEHILRHNSAGMHDQERQQANPANKFRILMLGDSFVWAGHVQEADTAHQVLENLFNQHQSTLSEVISAGVTGWGTGQELIYYRSEGRLYQPNLVLLFFYLGNDVEDNLPGEVRTLNGRNCYGPYFALCEGQLDPTPWLQAPGIKPVMGQCPVGRKMWTNALGWVYQHSGLYTQLEPLFAGQARSRDSAYYPLYIPEKNELLDYAWQSSLAIINQLHQEVSSDGAELVVVLVSPADVISLSQMNATELEAVYQKAPDLRKAQLDLPNRKLLEALTDAGVRVLDLQPLFIQRFKNSRELLFFPHDKHWNIAGNQFVAESIYDWLSQK